MDLRIQWLLKAREDPTTTKTQLIQRERDLWQKKWDIKLLEATTFTTSKTADAEKMIKDLMEHYHSELLEFIERERAARGET